jgi:hypothetical protein
MIFRHAWRTISAEAPGLMATVAARTTGGLLLTDHWLMIRLAIGSAIGIHRWLLRLRRNIGTRHLCYVVIGQYAPVTAIAIPPASNSMHRVPVVAIAITKPASAGAGTSCAGLAIAWPISRTVHMARRSTDDDPIRRRHRSMESRRRMRDARPAKPSVPSAGRPAPATPVDKHPTTVTIGHPAPGIR